MTSPWLTNDEIDDMCEGLDQAAAKVRHLEDMGLFVSRKPNGRPLVMRAHAEAVLSGLNKREIADLGKQPGAAPVGPRRGAIVEMFKRRQTA